VLLRTHAQPTDEPPGLYLAPAGSPHVIEGAWRVEFIAGGPASPAATTIERLTSWTEWPGDQEALRAFSGTARYTIAFEKPAASADAWRLDLGAVCSSAHVTLNGQPLGTCYARPFRVLLTEGLRDGWNELEIEVTNLMANRLAELDRRGEEWRRFFFVNIQYKPFDAAGWEPLPSGLLGPVQLTPLRQLDER
jgi:hypothetical protein